MLYNIKKLFNGLRLLIQKPKVFFKKINRIMRPMRKDYKKRFKMKLSSWLLYHQKNIAFDKCYWMGVRAIKNPFDAWIYQEIIYDVRPDIIIEIGSAEGGSTLYLANLLDILGKGTVISIDIDRTKYNVKHNRIIALTGDSSSSKIIAQVAKLCQDKSVLVLHDGDHRKEQVLKDLKNYAKFVSVNSYLIVEDGIVDLFKPKDGIGDFIEGPLPAIEEFLSKNPGFIVDKERERYILTYNPKGFLKRVR